MSYTPTNWETGDTITAEKLNKLEQGVANAGGGSGGGVLVVTLSADAGTMTINMDKTWQQIFDADIVTLRYEVVEGELKIGSVSEIYYDDDPSNTVYGLTPYFPTFAQGNLDFTCTSRDAFPAAEVGS